MDSDITAKVKILASFSEARDITYTIKNLIDTDLQKYCNFTEVGDRLSIHEKELRRIFYNF